MPNRWMEKLPEPLRGQCSRLVSVLETHAPLAVAYSGGVDSGFLAFVAHRALGDRMVCAIAVSPSLAPTEEDEALAFVETHGIPCVRIATREIDDPRYRANNADRCYFCKDELFGTMVGAPELKDYPSLAYGANVDDSGDYRPGAMAASERGVVAPLAEAGYTKEAIRKTARLLGLSLWDKPAAPCLASRIPYFSQVTRGKLAQIAEAEAVVKREGFRECRVRHHGELARVELPAADHRLATRSPVWKRIEEGLRKAGFARVELEPDGLRSGRLNEGIDAPRG
jgi:uncharacterized protein